MLAFTKHFSSKELKGFLRHGLINLHRSVIFPSDTGPNINPICWLVFIHSLCASFHDVPKVAFIFGTSGSHGWQKSPIAHPKRKDNWSHFKNKQRTSLVVHWWRIHPPKQGTQVPSLVQEDPMCLGATKPVCHNSWAWALETVLPSKKSHRKEKPVHHD